MNQDDKQESNLVSLYGKLFKVKSEMGAVVKSANNPFFRSKYADLNTHLDAIEPLLEKHGLVLTQSTLANPQLGNVVKTDVTDIATGAQVSSVLQLPKLEDMQKLGSAITYARRYTLGSLFAMQTEDDDANSASGKVTKVQAAANKVKAANNDF